MFTVGHLIVRQIYIKCCVVRLLHSSMKTVSQCNYNIVLSIIFIVVNTVCKLFSWRMYFFVDMTNCFSQLFTFLSIHCNGLIAWMLFSQSDFFHLIITGILIGYWNWLSKCCFTWDSIDRGTLLCAIILNQMGILI